MSIFPPCPAFFFFLIFTFWLFHVECGILAPHQESNLSLMHWLHGILTTGSPGSPSMSIFLNGTDYPHNTEIQYGET